MKISLGRNAENSFNLNVTPFFHNDHVYLYNFIVIYTLKSNFDNNYLNTFLLSNLFF